MVLVGREKYNLVRENMKRSVKPVSVRKRFSVAAVNLYIYFISARSVALRDEIS